MKRHMISLRLKLAFVIISVLVVGAFALNFVTPNSLIWSAFQSDSVRITWGMIEGTSPDSVRITSVDSRY